MAGQRVIFNGMEVPKGSAFSTVYSVKHASCLPLLSRQSHAHGGYQLQSGEVTILIVLSGRQSGSILPPNTSLEVVFAPKRRTLLCPHFKTV